MGARTDTSQGGTLRVMELHVTPETEAKLNELAERTHRGKEELLEEAVNHLVAYNEWLDRKVKDSLAGVERGETVSDEDVRSWMEQRERASLFTGILLVELTNELRAEFHQRIVFVRGLCRIWQVG